MHRLTIRLQHDPQVSTSHFPDACPAPNPAILLNSFTFWVLDCPQNPIVLDYGTVRPASEGSEIARCFHPTFVTGCVVAANQQFT